MVQKLKEDLFALFLKDVMSKSHDRDHWSYMLGVSKPAISQWCSGKTIPSESNLISLLFYLDQYNERELLTDFERLKHKKLKEVSNNYNKFKGSKTLNDYLLKTSLNLLQIRLNNSDSHIKGDVIKSVTSIITNSNDSHLSFENVKKKLIELESISSNLRNRIRQLRENEREKVFERVIQGLRYINKWLKFEQYRPVPAESKVWLRKDIKFEIEKQNGLSEIYRTGYRQLKGGEKGLPIVRIYSLDFSMRKSIELNDLYQMVMIIPFEGSFNVSFRTGLESKENLNSITLFGSRNDNTILPEMTLESNDLKCYIVLFSSGGVVELDDPISLYRNRGIFKETFRLLSSKYKISEFEELIKNSNPTRSVDDVHGDNRRQGILNIYKNSDDIIEYRDCPLEERQSWQFSLIEFGCLKEGEKVDTLYKHPGHELIIPLNNVKFQSVKCGVKIKEQNKREFSNIDFIDRYPDVYDLDDNSNTPFKPIIILDPEIPHAFQSLDENGEPSRCLHIYLRPRINSILIENEMLDRTNFEREKNEKQIQSLLKESNEKIKK